MIPSEITVEIELPLGLLLFLIVMDIFMIAVVYVTDMEVLEMMVQLLQESTSESENVMVMIGGA